jgi:hypothetical protein
VVSGEDGPGQVLEAAPAGGAGVTLAVRLGLILAVLDHLPGRAMRAGHSVRPAQFTDRLEAFGLIDEVGEIDHEDGPSESSGRSTSPEGQEYTAFKL